MDVTKDKSGLLLSAFCREQYQMVTGSREVLLEYCDKIAPAHFILENSSYGRGGSMRNLLVHIANCYEFWIGRHALRKPLEETAFSEAHSVAAIRPVFKRVDDLVNEFLGGLAKSDNKEIHFKINGSIGTASPLRLFTHVITHEFHHKGQLLSLSRHLGYTPVDTDIMR
jgi:uncharacterized damage-inducible protein DinB